MPAEKKESGGKKKTSPDRGSIKSTGTGLTDVRREDIPYEAATEKARSAKEYEVLKGVIEDPYVTENYEWIIGFIKNRASKFWKYLELRESGKKDKDKIRAASILEYGRLLLGLTRQYEDFHHKLIEEVVKQDPKSYQQAVPCSLADLVERLDELNRKDYLEAPAAEEEGKGPAEEVAEEDKVFQGEKGKRVLNDLLDAIEEQVKRSSPQFGDFSFDAKCSLLGSTEWITIIEALRKKHPELAQIRRSEIIKKLSLFNDDPRIVKVLYYVNQYRA